VAIRPNGAIRRQLRTLFNLGAMGELTDGQLLERFATQDGEAAELAFAALVERHWPMVLRVCQNTLRDPNDVQDAFQATFLVLVQKARSLWVRDSLGPWLHRVAHRVATRARSSAARRRELERRAAATRPTLVSERGDWEVSARSYRLAARAGRHPTGSTAEAHGRYSLAPGRGAARADVGRAERPCGRCWTRRGRDRIFASGGRLIPGWSARLTAASILPSAAGQAHSGRRMPMNENPMSHSW